MRYAISVPPGGDVAALLSLARATDESGWDGFFVWDHVYVADGWPLHDPWVLLGAAAVATSSVRLGAMVTPLARRRPWKLAKEVTTLDHLSSGRALVGVGLGAPAEDFTAFGETADPRARAVALDNGLSLLDGFLRGDEVRQGQVSARLTPSCVQKPRPPIWVAATWPHRRPLSRARGYEGVFLTGSRGSVTPEQVVAARAVVGPGLDIAVPLDRSIPPGELSDAGATWLIGGPESPDDWLSRLRPVIEAGPPG